MLRENNEKRITEINTLRQKEMSSDTAKLVALASDLKTEMDKTAQASLSVEALRKAELIEKLAHAVQSKMKATVAQ